jgi:RNA polymerase sigma factor (sigma-70 family)
VATVPATRGAFPASADAAAEATRDLYERFSRQIFAYCLMQLRNREEAEDATQTTFLNAFRGLERGVVPELESAWLYKIAQHVCLTRQRSWSRRRVVESPQDLEQLRELVRAPVKDVDAVAGLTDALRELPEQQRRAILLREWRGLTYKEIADELELSQAAVETLLFRARRALAQSLEKLRGTGDLGSLVAALKSLLLGGGTKVAATLVTVATTSVVAATPATRHGVVHFVDAVTQTAAPTKPDRPSQEVRKPAALAPEPVAHAAAPKPRAKRHHIVKATLVEPVVHTTRKTTVVAMPAPEVRDTPAKPRAKPQTATVVATSVPSATRAAVPRPVDDAPAPTTTMPVKPTPTVATSSAPPATVPAPSIGGFTPTSGTPGTIVQVLGKSLTGATAVQFNGTNADFKVTSDGQITTKVPTAASSGSITIVTPNGTVTSDGSFTVAAPSSPAPSPPGISGTSPGSGPVGQSVGIGGKFFTGATAVRFNGTSAEFTVVSDTLITTHVPDGATTGPVTVVTPNGTATSAASFTVTIAAATITGLSPASGAAGTTVQIGGSRLEGATSVRFNGVAAEFTIVSDGQITARVPTGATSGPVTVVTPQGTATSSGSFSVTATAPTIEGFSPATGAPGAYVTIAGHNFTGATSVKFNGMSATFSVASDSQLYAKVPTGATSGPISVSTANGTATSAAAFTVTPAAPEISGTSPGSGPVGSSVSIGGRGFTGATSVKFNGVAASFAVNSDGLITAVVPAEGSSGPISVTTPNGTATSSSSFTVTH